MPILIRLVKYALRQRALAIVTVLVLAASIVPRVALPRLVGDAVDALLAQGRDALPLIAAQMILAGVVRAVLGYLGLYLAERVGRVTEFRIRNDFVDKLQRLNFGFYDRQKTGDLMSRATVDAEACARFIAIGVMHGIAFLTLFFLPIITMLIMNWQLGLIVFVGSLLISGYGVALAVRLFRIYRQAHEETGRMNILLQESMTGIRTVKALGSQDFEQRRFRERAAAVATNFVLADRLSVTREAVLTLPVRRPDRGNSARWRMAGAAGAAHRSAPCRPLCCSWCCWPAPPWAWSGGCSSSARAMAAGARIFEVLDTRNPLVVAEDARELSATGTRRVRLGVVRLHRRRARVARRLV